MQLTLFKFAVISAGLAFSVSSPQPSLTAHDVTQPSYTIGTLKIGAESIEPQVLGEQTSDAPEQKAEEQPEPTVITVTVVKGDSLSKIAKAHQTTVQRLYDANTFISDPNIINPGDVIIIPNETEVIEARQLPKNEPKPVAKKVVTSTQVSAVASNAPAVASGSVWDQLAKCESGGNWAINTGNGYYGGQIGRAHV